MRQLAVEPPCRPATSSHPHTHIQKRETGRETTPRHSAVTPPEIAWHRLMRASTAASQHDRSQRDLEGITDAVRFNPHANLNSKTPLTLKSPGLHTLVKLERKYINPKTNKKTFCFKLICRRFQYSSKVLAKLFFWSDFFPHKILLTLYLILANYCPLRQRDQLTRQSYQVTKHSSFCFNVPFREW